MVISVNPELVNRALDQLLRLPAEKSAFLAASDPSLAGGDMAAAQQMQGGGAPTDPAAMAAGGGAPAAPAPAPAPAPADPSGGGGMPVTADQVRQIVMEALQGGGAGGKAGAGPGMKKPDVGTELHRNNMLLAKLLDHFQIPVQAQEMFSDGSEPPGTVPQPAAAAAGGGQGGQGGLAPLEALAPAQTAQPAATESGQQKSASVEYGTAFRLTEPQPVPLQSTSDNADLLLQLIQRR